MRPATALSESTIRLDEPVRTLLRNKTRTVWSIDPDASVFEAIEMMSNRQVGALAVLRGEMLLGIVSERDYARKVILMGRSSKETLVRQIMSAPVLFVTPEQTIDECMRLMTTRRIRHIPVMEHQSLVGMVSMGDVVNWMISSQEHTIRHLQKYISGDYPG